jgi:putative ABC transport system ATP-binding protein
MLNDKVIRLENIHKVYDSGDVRVHALRGVSLEIERGGFVAIMGTSGSGKSTMMNILGCLDRPTQGHYYLDGVDVSNFSKDERAVIRNQKLAFVFQGYNLLRRTSAVENVELPLIYADVPADERYRRSMRALEIVGLAHKADSHPNQLSGGQQQRVAVARALVNEPAMLLADEPTGNLDSRTSIEVMGVFQQLNDSGITVVLVTHEPDIAQYAKRVVVMKDGEIILDQPVRKRRHAEIELAATPHAVKLEDLNIEEMMR